MPSRAHRITRGDDYKLTVRRGTRVGGAYSIAHAVSHAEQVPARFGYIITRKLGGAVVRNKVRRRMKAVSDELIAQGITGVSIVFRALPSASKANYRQLRDDMRAQVAKIERKLQGERQSTSTGESNRP